MIKNILIHLILVIFTISFSYGNEPFTYYTGYFENNGERNHADAVYIPGTQGAYNLLIKTKSSKNGNFILYDDGEMGYDALLPTLTCYSLESDSADTGTKQTIYFSSTDKFHLEKADSPIPELSTYKEKIDKNSISYNYSFYYKMAKDTKSSKEIIKGKISGINFHDNYEESLCFSMKNYILANTNTGKDEITFLSIKNKKDAGEKEFGSVSRFMHIIFPDSEDIFFINEFFSNTASNCYLVYLNSQDKMNKHDKTQVNEFGILGKTLLKSGFDFIDFHEILTKNSSISEDLKQSGHVYITGNPENDGKIIFTAEPYRLKSKLGYKKRFEFYINERRLEEKEIVE